MAYRKSLKLKRIEDENGEGNISPILACDFCGRMMKTRGGNVRFAYVINGEMKVHLENPVFICKTCLPGQWQKDEAEGIMRADMSLAEFLRKLEENTNPKKPKKYTRMRALP